MSKEVDEASPQQLKNLTIIAFFILGILVSIAIFGVRQVEQDTKVNLVEQLQSTLKANIATLKFWFKEKKLDAEVIAAEPLIQENRFRSSDFFSSPQHRLPPWLFVPSQTLILHQGFSNKGN